MKMISVIWFLSSLALLVADDVGTNATQQKEVEALRCYQCLHSNQTSFCEQRHNLAAVICPPDLPYCATSAVSPDYASSLTCSSGSQTPCTLLHKAKDTYEMTCTCAGHLCNAPFSRELRNELLNFSSSSLPDNITLELTEAFINSTVFAKIAVVNLYEAITVTREATMLKPERSSSMLPQIFEDVSAPQAEALKHEATVPPDDDEDETEGSGSFEDAKPQIPAAPAAPSSFLPANENKAIPVHINILATIPFISLYTVV